MAFGDLNPGPARPSPTTPGTSTYKVDHVNIPELPSGASGGGPRTGGGTGGPTSGQHPGQTPLTSAQNSALAYLRSVLDEYGLGDLAGWAADELRKGYDDVVVLQHLREQDAFKSRFKVIFDRQDKGLPAISPAQVIEYERTAAQLMGRFGMPRGFYDNPADFHDLLLKDVSPAELQVRLEQGYAQVVSAPQEVRDVFRDFYGVDGDNALASFFLDPEKSQPVLETKLAAAQDAGAGRRFGFDLNYDQADRLARVGVGQDQAAKGFLQLNSQAGLYHEGFGEHTDLTAEEEGVRATFGLDAEAQRVVDRRAQGRQAQFGGGGGASDGKTGVSGAGSADQ